MKRDFDACLGDPIAGGVLYLQQGAADVGEIDPSDVQQGPIGDCYVLATLDALANTPRGRAAIRGAIVENRDPGGQVVSWTVTLHRPETHLFGPTTFSDVRITVDARQLVGYATSRREGSSAGACEVWPRVMERAFAIYSGGYNNIGRGGVAAEALTIITGREARYVSSWWPLRLIEGYVPDKLLADIANGKPVVLTTWREASPSDIGPDGTFLDPQAHGLVAMHSYAVAGVTYPGGRPCLKLINPWGKAQPNDVPISEVTRWFSSVAVGSLP